MAMVKRTAGSPAAARLRPPISTRTSAGSRRTRATIGPRCGPRPISLAMPAVSGVSAQPSSANQRGARMRTQSTSAGRMPPNTRREAGAQRMAVTSRAAPRIDQREIGASRIGQEPHRAGIARLPEGRQFEPLAPGRRRQHAAAPAPSPPRAGGVNGLVHGDAAGGALAASAFIAATDTDSAAPARRRDIDQRRHGDGDTPTADNTAATGMTRSRPTRRRRRARRGTPPGHERQRVAREGGVLERRWKTRYGSACPRPRHSVRRSRTSRTSAPAAASISTTRRAAPCPTATRTCAAARRRAAAASGSGRACRRRRSPRRPACRARRGRPASPPLATSSGTAPRDAPMVKVIDAAEQRAGHAAADAIGEHQQQQRRREPQRLRAEPDGEAGQQRAEHDQPARGRHLVPARAGDRRRHAAAAATTPRRRQAWAASAAASPGMSLIGRDRHVPHERAARRAAPWHQGAPPGAPARRVVGAALVRPAKASGPAGAADERRGQRATARRAPALRPVGQAVGADAARVDGGGRLCRARCRRDSRADAAGARRHRSRGRRARSSPSRCLRAGAAAMRRQVAATADGEGDAPATRRGARGASRDGPQAKRLVQAAQAIALQVEGHVLVAERPSVRRRAARRCRARGRAAISLACDFEAGHGVVVPHAEDAEPERPHGVLGLFNLPQLRRRSLRCGTGCATTGRPTPARPRCSCRRAVTARGCRPW